MRNSEKEVRAPQRRAFAVDSKVPGLINVGHPRLAHGKSRIYPAFDAILMSELATEAAYVNCLRAAEILNVSVSTIKRMCDQDLLDCARTSGGHRRISTQSLARWQTLQRSHADEVEQNYSDATLDVGCTLEMLLSSSADQLAAFVVYARANGLGVVELIDRLLFGALRYCVQQCELGQRPSYKIRQCIASIRSILGHLQLQQDRNAADAPVAIGGCVGPAKDDLTSTAIAVSLAEIGCRSFVLGSRISVDELASAALDHQASVVWMNCSSMTSTEEMIEDSIRLNQRLGEGPMVLLTGCGEFGSDRRKLQCDFSANSMQELSNFVNSRRDCLQPARLRPRPTDRQVA